ncbi:MAG: DUF3662 domain-containing protein [Chloroflexi bacterium]|nr:DUF3662 domain-containing protein [Chloroflexota bacterium]
MNLEELEARLQALIEVRLVNALAGQKKEDLIVQKLSAAMQANLLVQEDEVRLAPHVFTIVVNPASIAHWQDLRLFETLVEILKALGLEKGLRFSSPPVITLAEDPRLQPENFNVIASHRISTMEETNNMQIEPGNATEDNDAIPENAFLIIEGVKVFPLRQAVVNIGRRLDNTLVIDDPRVSRNHAQLRAIKGRLVIFDLNSTGGTFVNGQRANQSVLYPGDVISLAGMALIFGQDNPPPRPDLASTSPLNKAGTDRPTAMNHILPPTKKKKK